MTVPDPVPSDAAPTECGDDHDDPCAEGTFDRTWIAWSAYPCGHVRHRDVDTGRERWVFDSEMIHD